MDSLSLKELLAIVVLAGAVLALVLGGWNAWIQTKLGSLGRLWNEFNAHIEKYGNDRVENVEDYACKDDFNTHVKNYNDGRLADAKEFASKSDLAKVETWLKDELKGLNLKMDEVLKGLAKR